MAIERIGVRPDGAAVNIIPANLIDSRLLIQASSGAGKSYLLRLLVERLGPRIPVIVLDPEGEFSTLRERLDMILVGASGEIPALPRTAAMLARRLAESQASAVIDLSDLKLDARRQYVRNFLLALVELPKSLWHSRIVVIDEAHLFAPEGAKCESTEAVISLMSLGRKRGLCGVIATQRISKLHKDAAAEAANVFTGRITLDVDLRRACDTLGMVKSDWKLLRELNAGEWLAFGPAIHGVGVQRFKADKVETTHPQPGERRKLQAPAPSKSVSRLVAEMADLSKKDSDDPLSIEDAIAIIARQKRDHAAQVAELKREQAKTPPEAIDALKRKCGDLERRLREALKHESRAEAFRGVAWKTANQLSDASRGIDAALESVRKCAELYRFAYSATELAKLDSQFPPPAEDRDCSDYARLPTGTIKAGDPVETAMGPGRAIPSPKNGDGLAAPFPWVEIPPERNGKKLGGGMLRMIRELADRAPARFSESQWASLAKLKKTGGTWGEYKGRLKRAGLIDQDASGLFYATEAAIEEYGDPSRAPSSPADLRADWARKLGKGPGRMLEIMAETPTHTHWLRESLADQMGLAADGGTFGEYLGRLRRNGLIEVEPGVGFRLVPALFG